MAAVALGLFGLLLVLFFQQASLLYSPVGASHKEFKTAHPDGLFSKRGEFPYQVYMYVVHEKVCNETQCFFLGAECGGAIANEVGRSKSRVALAKILSRIIFNRSKFRSILKNY